MPVSTTKMFKELESLLEKYGITVKSWEMGKRHRKVWVTDGAKTALIVVSVSPSDHRAYMNIAQSARNALREAR
jgi:hypothetical protein